MLTDMKELKEASKVSLSQLAKTLAITHVFSVGGRVVDKNPPMHPLLVCATRCVRSPSRESYHGQRWAGKA